MTLAKTAVDWNELKLSPLEASNAPIAFCCGDGDLDEFLRDDAERLHRSLVAKTFLASYGERCVAYISLLADVLQLKANDKKKIGLHHDDPPAIPGLKIARLAVCQDFREQYSGVGTRLMAFAFAVGLDLTKKVACRLLTVDAYPTSVGFYERLGFTKNKLREPKEGNTVSMRLDLLGQTLPPWFSPVAKS